MDTLFTSDAQGLLPQKKLEKILGVVRGPGSSAADKDEKAKLLRGSL